MCPASGRNDSLAAVQRDQEPRSGGRRSETWTEEDDGRTRKTQLGRDGTKEGNLIPLRLLTKARGQSVMQETCLFQLLHILPRASDASCTQNQAGKGYAQTRGL